MKTALAIYGAIHVLLLLLGAMGGVDYYLCIKDAGQCKSMQEGKK